MSRGRARWLHPLLLIGAAVLGGAFGTAVQPRVVGALSPCEVPTWRLTLSPDSTDSTRWPEAATLFVHSSNVVAVTGHSPTRDIDITLNAYTER